MKEPTELEQTFLTIWRQITGINGPVLMREYRFHHTRRWRFDFAYPEKKVAVECEGGVFSGGRHVRGKGFEGDCEKYNIATSLGWRVYRVTANMLKKDPAGFIKMVVDSIG